VAGFFGDISPKWVFFKGFGSLGGQSVSLDSLGSQSASLGSLGGYLEKEW
jgi:hypothetical protein